jgi:hypothetical protein
MSDYWIRVKLILAAIYEFMIKGVHPFSDPPQSQEEKYVLTQVQHDTVKGHVQELMTAVSTPSVGTVNWGKFFTNLLAILNLVLPAIIPFLTPGSSPGTSPPGASPP